MSDESLNMNSLKTAKCIAFANLKGGTGKTTTCVNTAGYLVKSQEDCQVLVVDFDPQANATSGLGIDETTLEYSLYDAVLDQCDGYSGASITQIILGTHVENLHLAPSELNLGSAPMLMSKVKDPVSVLAKILQPIKQFYDYILIDVPPDAGWFMFNSLCCADRLVVPLDSSIFSLEALAKLQLYCRDIQEIKGKTHELTLVLNQYKKSKSKSSLPPKKLSPCEDIEQELKKMSAPLFLIPESILIYRSQQEGVPISHYPSPTSQIGKAYQAIAQHLMD